MASERYSGVGSIIREGGYFILFHYLKIGDWARCWMVFWRVADCVLGRGIRRARLILVWALSSLWVYALYQCKRFSSWQTTEKLPIEPDLGLCWNWIDCVTVVVFTSVNPATPFLVRVDFVV